MKLKKVLALGLAMLMTVSAFTACGNTDAKESVVSSGSEKTSEKESQAAESETTAEESEGITFPLEEAMTFTGLTVLNGEQYKLSECIAWTTAAEMGNLNFELTEIPNSESKEKTSLLFAGEDYPEFIYKVNHDGYEEWGMEGLLIPLEDLIREYMPNLTAILDERDGWNVITSADGHIYTLPYITPSLLDNGGAPLWINKTWMDNLGLKEPTDLDELYDVLKAFKENDCNGNGDPNDEIPFTLTTDSSWYPARRFIQYVGDGLQMYTKYLAIMDGEMVFYPFTDSFKDNYLAYLKKLYDEEILDQNAFTQTHEQLHVLGQSENIYGMFFASNAYSCVPEDYVKDYICLKPFSALPMTSGIGKNGMVITDKCENPEVLCAWVDYFYSEEGSRLATLGVEGVTYTLNDQGEWSLVEGANRQAEAINGTSNWAGMLSLDQYKINSEEDPKTAWCYSQVYDAEEGLFASGKYGEVLPTLTYTEEEQKVVSQYESEIKAYVATYIAQVVTGQVDLEGSWDDFQKTLRDMHAEDLLAASQAAYARFIAE